MKTKTKKTILKKNHLILISMVVFISLNCLIALAESSKSINNNISTTKNSPVTIQSICVYEPNSTFLAQALTPQKEYDIKVTVNDNDCIGNPDGGLDKLNIKLWYDKDGDDILLNPPDESVFNSYNSYNPQNSLKIKWVRGGTASLIGGGETWNLNQKKSILPNESNLNDTTFEFVFNIKIGKIAKEASSTNRWQIAAKITDVDGFESYKAFEKPTGFGLEMDFYGEMVMDTTTVDVNNLFTTNTNGEIVYEVKNISFISNSKFNKTVKADNFLVDINDYKNLLFRMHNADNKNTFALRANKVSNFNTSKILPLNKSNLVFDKDVSPSTSEKQKNENNFLYILLNKNFNKDIHYKGTIIYGINNSF